MSLFDLVITIEHDAETVVSKVEEILAGLTGTTVVKSQLVPKDEPAPAPEPSVVTEAAEAAEASS